MSKSKTKKKTTKKLGRPTKYNQDIQDRADKYVRVLNLPFMEELALELDVDDDTLYEWARRYKAFSVTIKRLAMKQKLGLLKISMNKDYATSGAIFQLKANHGMVETEKKIIGGDPDNPITHKVDIMDSKSYTHEINEEAGAIVSSTSE